MRRVNLGKGELPEGCDLSLEEEIRFAGLFGGFSIETSNGEKMALSADDFRTCVRILKLYEVDNVQDLLDNYKGLSRTCSLFFLICFPDFRRVIGLRDKLWSILPPGCSWEKEKVEQLVNGNEAFLRMNSNIAEMINVYLSGFEKFYSGECLDAWLFNISDSTGGIPGYYVYNKVLNNMEESNRNLEYAVESNGAVPFDVAFTVLKKIVTVQKERSLLK